MSPNKTALLNKFLSKTYHMLETCHETDPSVASWSSDGQSFIVKDVAFFSKEILKKYFKHSKFSSFVRQLNFYSFSKIRKYTNTSTGNCSSVAFAHPYFRKGRPDLLQKIQRSTKNPDLTSSQMAKSIRDQVSEMQFKLECLSRDMDKKLADLATTVEAEYQVGMQKVSLSYQAIAGISASFNGVRSPWTIAPPTFSGLPPNSAPPQFISHIPLASVTCSESSGSSGSSTTSSENEVIAAPPRLPAGPPNNNNASPLMTLSGVATAIIRADESVAQEGLFVPQSLLSRDAAHNTRIQF